MSIFLDALADFIIPICGAGGCRPLTARCEIAPRGKPCDPSQPETGCTGIVTFEMEKDTCVIKWDLKNCGKEGLHGFHIHEKADFSDGCASAGPHYNPDNKQHGGPQDKERHVGDMGNIVVDKNGCSKGELRDHLIKLSGPWSVIGRSVMVHADPDDLGRGDNSQPGVNGKTSKTTGNAGARIGCGEIRYGRPF
ncbi:unnamed protein product [Amoebophrya sp. A25]|nr:unnamed protein product [Amoebophrya sp. A25]|eukprot:GSA25T00010159001.1